MKIKNILIITYDWMPRNSIAVHRPYAWAKYWSREGFAVTVLTAKKCSYDEPLGLNLPYLEFVDVVEVSYRNTRNHENKKNIFEYKRKLIWLLKKNSFLIKKFFNLNYDIRDAWAKYAIPIALDLYARKNFELIVSTYGPRACHYIAERVKSNHPSVLWLADYRDLWSIRHNSDLIERQMMREKEIERKVVSRADVLTTVSEPLANDLSVFLNKKVHVVFNGFDADWGEVVSRLKRHSNKIENVHGRLNITYTGMIYPGWRDPSPLFISIKNLIANNTINTNDIHVNFYGARQPGLEEIIDRYSAWGFVTIHGHVTREIALKEQENADLLLLLESDRPEAKGVLTGKLFEYMISGKPILSIGSVEGSSIGEIIMQTGVGVVCENDISKIESVLVKTLSNDYHRIYAPNIEKICSYQRSKQSSDLINLLSERYQSVNKITR